MCAEKSESFSFLIIRGVEKSAEFAWYIVCSLGVPPCICVALTCPFDHFVSLENLSIFWAFLVSLVLEKYWFVCVARHLVTLQYSFFFHCMGNVTDITWIWLS